MGDRSNRDNVKTKSNPTVSHQLELVGVVSWTWVGLGFDNCLHIEPPN